MVAIPTVVDTTLQAADAALEANARKSRPRPYIGMSAIGRPCDRALWYGFRWAKQPDFDAATLKRFDDGHRGEDLQAERLRMVSTIELLTVDPTTGQQFAYVDHGGHFRGHCDGLISGLIQAPRTRHVWEHKQTADKKQAQLNKSVIDHGEKGALAAWDETYYAQAQLYMAYSGTDRHYLTCSSPGGRHTVSVRTDLNTTDAERYRDRALRIIQSHEPPPRLSEKPEFYICKWCEFSDICHSDELPAPNCRSCCHATPELDGDGRWSCAHWCDDIPREHQSNGCINHVYLPALINYAVALASDPEHNLVRYKTNDGREFTTGTKPCVYSPDAPHYTSVELHALDPKLISDQRIELIRNEFGATIAKDASA